MAKRKFKQNHKVSDDEIEFQRPKKQIKKQNSTTRISVQNVPFSSNEEHDEEHDSDTGNLLETSDTAADDSYYENFSSFLKAFSFDAESDEIQKFNDNSQNAFNGCENSMNDGQRRKSHEEVPHASSSSHDNMLEDEFETNIRIVHVPSKLSEVVLLQHPASLTLHGYVGISVWLGSINIFGYKVKESEDISVFSTEGTGLKKVSTVKSVHKSTIKRLQKKLESIMKFENVDVKELLENVGPMTVVLIVKKILLPAPLRVLELYYPHALQTRWPRNDNFDSKTFKLCSTEESFVIDISKDFKMMSREVKKAIFQTVSSDACFGPRIMVLGDKNMGKSTLIRYLMNSSLNYHPMVYFLDTDPGQTEYTPPGVVSLFQVTKPLLGPPFAHQKQPLRMVFIGSITPGTCSRLYNKSVNRLLKYFNRNFHKETLFVNTIGWNKGIGALCTQQIKEDVQPTLVIELVSPEPGISFTKVVAENGVTYLKAPSKVPSRESCAPSYNAKELRNFSIVSYLGQCQKPYLPVSLMNSFHPVCVSWDKIALHVMGKKVAPHRLIEAMHCSIVALCRVDLSYVLKADNPLLPMILSDEPLCECLGFGLIRASDETNHLFYILTPLSLDQLKNVNALIKGNIMIPDKIILNQTIPNVPLPFTDHSQGPKNPAGKPVCKRAFHRTAI